MNRASRQGRWLSPDPAGAGWNLYAYATNPNSRIDPLGLDDDPCDPTNVRIGGRIHAADDCGTGGGGGGEGGDPGGGDPGGGDPGGGDPGDPGTGNPGDPGTGNPGDPGTGNPGDPGNPNDPTDPNSPSFNPMSPDPNLFGNLIYDLPGYQNPSAEAYGVYRGCLSYGFQCGANGNYYNPDYSGQAQAQYDRLQANLAAAFPSAVLDSTTCELNGAHCNFLCTDFCPPVGRYPNGIHVGKGGWIHDDTVSPWIGPFTLGAILTGNFWEHGFVDLIGGTFFVGAFPE